MSNNPTEKGYVQSRKKLSGWFFETGLPNEYLVRLGAGKLKPLRGGRKFRWLGLRRFIRIPASIQTLEFATDNANIHFQGLGIEGYASWQIQEDNPAQAIATLDMFDDADPMARTNNELNLICVEAVRHVIANMTIEDAMRKKEDIAGRLKEQLKQVESRWGIIFHQVGIRKVKVMSSHVFEDLQASYRNELRLNSASTRIDADRKIAQQENILREQTEMERIGTDQKLRLAEAENQSSARAAEMEQEKKLAESTHELETRRIELETQRKKNYEAALLELDVHLAELEQRGERIRLEIARARRELEQTHSESALLIEVLKALPDIARSQKIENYTVMDGNGVSPLARLLNEVSAILKNKSIIWPDGNKE